VKRTWHWGSTGCVVALALAGCGGGPSGQGITSSMIGEYCVDCHNDIEQVADLSLERLDFAHLDADRETWEKVLKKLNAGMMPPPDSRRPDLEAYAAVTSWVEQELDESWKPYMPPPGAHRLNRTEYANVIRDLLAVDVEASAFLPTDDASSGFDNQAGTLGMSPALLEAYLSAAGKISRLAVGEADGPTQAVYRLAEDTTQNYHVEGLPFGTRGGILVDHYFPVDGEYTIKIFSVNLGNMGNFRPFGEVRGEQLEVLLDGERLALLDWDEEFNLNRGFGGGNGQLKTIDVRVPVTAGPHKIGVTFLATNFAPLLDLNNAFERSTIETGGLPGFTFYPHVGSVRIDGPFNVAGVSETPAREKIFVCRPAAEADEDACAERIVSTLARRAFRGFDTEEDVSKLMSFYEQGRQSGGFDTGVQMALQRILVDPKFIYRFELEPADVAEGELYELNDLALASRLSFFLWSSMPDDELLTLAEQNRLSEPGVLEAQVRRLIDDPRSEAFTANFAGQWLALRNLDGHQPVVDEYPDFDDNLRQAFRRETELFFASILREGRSALDLLTADHTFVNDRLAKHYGIPGVQGSHFRRIELGEEFDERRGLLGKGSILTTSSQPGRTSPVIRGNWIMTHLIGVPPPPPPPNVPELEASEEDLAGNAEQPTLREMLERHRDNPACMSCHALMDPFGFAMEPFDAIGRKRATDNGKPINASDVMYDGTPVEGPSDVREFLVTYSEQFITNLTEKLLTYALGRGVTYYDMPVVRSIVSEAAENEHRLDEMITAVVKSSAFRMNTKTGQSGTFELTRDAGAAEPTTAAVGNN
jgi:hypothetical protein